MALSEFEDLTESVGINMGRASECTTNVTRTSNPADAKKKPKARKKKIGARAVADMYLDMEEL